MKLTPNSSAREIHDTLAQEVAGILAQLQAVKFVFKTSPQAAEKHLDRAQSLASSSLADARRMVLDLRHQALNNVDLPTALSNVIRQANPDSSLQVEFAVDSAPRRLPNIFENNILRIGQAVRREQRTPYIQQWNLTVERELPGGINLQVSYVGTKGTHIVSQTLPLNGTNAIDRNILASARREFIRTGSNPLDNSVANPFFGSIPPGSPTLSGPNITLLNLSKPYAQFTDVTLFSERIGSSDYHAGQVSVRRAFRNGFEVGGNYVFSKNIDFGNSISVTNGGNINGGVGSFGFNLNDFSLERAPASNDVRHRAVIFYVTDLPFGKGQPLLADVPVLSRVIGGFKVSGITTFQSGLPLAITGGSGFSRPDVIDDPVLPEQFRCFGDGVTACPLPDGSTIVVPNRRRLYFNPRAFRGRTVTIAEGASAGQIRNDLYWYGTSPRYSDRLRGTGQANFDLTFWREFAFGENKRLELRAEAINVFNRT